MSTAPLRILLLGDEDLDGHPVIEPLRAAGHEVRCAVTATPEAARAALRDGEAPCDAVVALLRLGGSGFAEVIAAVHAEAPDTPVVLFVPPEAEDEAAECVRQGAYDYVSSDRPARLVPIIERACREADERRRLAAAEAQALHRLRQFDRVFATSRSGLLLMDAATFRVVAANPAACTLLGYSEAELCELSQAFDLAVEPDSIRQERRAGIAGGEDQPPVLRQMRRKDGETIHVEVATTSVRLEDGRPGALAELRDVTALVEADQALRSSEQRYRVLVESSARGVAMIRRGGEILFANSTLLDLLGHSFESLSARSWRDIIVAADQIEASGRVTDVRRRRTSRRHLRLIRRDTRVIDVEASVVSLDEDDGPQGTLLVEVEDITERLELEREIASTREQLMQAQKSEALGTLIAGVAHDFNNLLTAIGGSLELAMRDLGSDDRWLRNALTATERASDLVRQLLQFSRRDAPDREPVSLPILVTETVNLARETFDRRIAIEVQPPPEGLPEVLADEGQIQQVLMNLLVNARDAVAERLRSGEAAYRPRISVRYSTTRLVPPGSPAAAVTVQDNGPGMSDEVRLRAFDPFFTTKAPGEGTGLGLATAFGIVTEHGGSLTARSQPTGGAAFTICLPAVPEPGDAGADGRDPGRTTETAPVRPNARVLVVDDEPLIREVARQSLTRAGYDVLAAAGGLEAIDIARRRPVDLVVLDVNMPSPNGWETLRELHRVAPNVPVLMASGYSSEQEARERGAAGFMGKPYTPRQLLEAVGAFVRVA